jgi:hypothetical protein
MTAAVATDKESLFSPQVRQEIDRWVEKYPADWKQ